MHDEQAAQPVTSLSDIRIRIPSGKIVNIYDVSTEQDYLRIGPASSFLNHDMNIINQRKSECNSGSCPGGSVIT